jgi:hypothetical protein
MHTRMREGVRGTNGYIGAVEQEKVQKTRLDVQR